MSWSRGFLKDLNATRGLQGLVICKVFKTWLSSDLINPLESELVCKHLITSVIWLHTHVTQLLKLHCNLITFTPNSKGFAFKLCDTFSSDCYLVTSCGLITFNTFNVIWHVHAHTQSTFKAFYSEPVASVAVKQQYNERELIDSSHNPIQSGGGA